MEIELKKYKRRKHFFKFIFNMLNFKLLRNSGYFSIKHWRAIIKNRKSRSYLFMILVDKEIAGLITLIKDKDSRRWISGIFLFKKYWGKGIAVKASKLFAKFLKKKRIKKIYAETFFWNKKAINFLNKLEFKEIKRKGNDIIWEKKL